ncbi:MAG: hypothetical protein QME60_03095 [Verrucomicrobiota bacterium]|nr:hypothetical protein [Verrucomicrobiota bacterium]
MSRASTSIYLELSYPTSFTNQIDIFSVDGGMGLSASRWSLRLTTNISTSTNYVCWTDSMPSHAQVRFYAAANADLTAESDPDEDDLT